MGSLVYWVRWSAIHGRRSRIGGILTLRIAVLGSIAVLRISWRGIGLHRVVLRADPFVVLR